MKKWNELPLDMQVEEVKKYYKSTKEDWWQSAFLMW